MRLRTALAGSLLLHGGFLAAFGAGLFDGPVRAPAPLTVTAEIPLDAPLEPDLPPLEVELPPETAEPPPMPEPIDLSPPMEDPRFLDPEEPPGPPAEVIGISSIDGRRRGLPGIRAGRGRVPAPKAEALPADPPPEPPAPDPVFLPPSLKVDCAPVYPPAVRRAGIQGTVRVRVEVEADGGVRSAEVAVSSGNAALDAAAVEAAAAWEFLPATEDGRAVASVVYRFVSFTLTDAR